jgi:hypothetical protein
MSNMYVVLRWGRYPTWPTDVVGDIVDDKNEAIAYAQSQRRGEEARGWHGRFTVHTLSWPPLADTEEAS